MYRHHIHARRRSILREDPLPLSDESELKLAEQLAAGSAASDRLLRSEIRQRVRQAIGQLRPADHEIIVLKHLEELSFADVAEILEVSVAAAHSRYYRAIHKLHELLQHES
jgi:RNA polymerase sigma-70 factor (ECF subfamily)